MTLTAGLACAAAELNVPVPPSALADAREFTIRRYEQQLIDTGHDHHFVTAVLPLADAPATADETLAELARRTGSLARRTASAEFAALVAALQRVRRIVPPDATAGEHAELLTDPAERALADALSKVEAALDGSRSLAAFADVAVGLVGPVNDFFDSVLVMADDPNVRAARLGLLAAVRDLAGEVLDWAALPRP